MTREKCTTKQKLHSYKISDYLRSEGEWMVRLFYSVGKRAGRFQVESRDWSEWVQEDHRNVHYKELSE